jgi:hypothetical protein
VWEDRALRPPAASRGAATRNACYTTVTAAVRPVSAILR